jgi:hypothetical protein
MTVAPAGVESLLGAGAGATLVVDVLDDALPVPALELVLEAVLLPATAVLFENGLAPPEPQPTIEAMAKAATLNFKKTLEVKPT